MANDPERLSGNKRIALRGCLIALAMILSYIESFIPFFSSVPGIKLGLANIVTLYALEVLGLKDTLIISLLRILLSAVLFGNPAMMIYSLSGALLSILVMKLLSGSGKFGLMGISVAGAVSHNAAQCVVAAVLLQNMSVIRYMPILILSGIIAGLVTGTVSGAILRKVL